MKRLIHTLGAFLFLLALAACESKVNQANFDKIKGNMTEQEVIAILGEPAESTTLGRKDWKKSIWKNDKTGEFADIQFMGDQALGNYTVQLPFFGNYNIKYEGDMEGFGTIPKSLPE